MQSDIKNKLDFMKFKFYSKYKLRITNSRQYPVIKINDNKFIFIHINKTAGTSILNFFGKHKLHLTVQELISLLGKKEYNNAIKFTVVRNPYDRIISQYFHTVKINRKGLQDTPIGLNNYVKEIYGKSESHYKVGQNKHYQKQLCWLINFNKKIDVNHILKYETLDQDFSNFINNYKIEGGLPFLNKSKRKSEKLDNNSIKIINKYFEDDFKMFDYKIIDVD